MKKISLLLIITLLACLPITALAEAGEENITRADFVVQLLTEGNVDIDEVLESSFTDVTDPDLIPYIETAYNKGIVSGFGDIFNPQGYVSKEQAITMIVKVFGESSALKNLSGEDLNNTLVFSDSSSISSWAKPYIIYALSTELIQEDGINLNPKALITKDAAENLIATAKVKYEELFTREGLSASDMLILANEKNNEYSTYKQKGTLEMNMKMNVEGLPQEELENNGELNALLGQGMNMTLDMDIQVAVPDKAYIKETIKSTEGEEDINIDVEIFMDGSTMYTKMPGSDKWNKQDMSSIMNQIQSISSNEPYKMSQLSDADIKFFKDYAKFEDTVELEGNEFYVISMNIDKETFKEYYMKIIEKAMDSVVELQVNNPQFQQDPNFNSDQYKELMLQMVSQMEIEMEYKFYIDKENKTYDKMWVSQDMYMSMDQIIAMVKETIQSEDTDEEMPDISVTMVNHSEGEFNFYDFDGEVNFPEITEEDIMNTPQPLPQIETLDSN